MTISVFVGTGLDGFIARPNGKGSCAQGSFNVSSSRASPSSSETEFRSSAPYRVTFGSVT